MIQWAGARSVPLVLCLISLACLGTSVWIARSAGRPKGYVTEPERTELNE